MSSEHDFVIAEKERPFVSAALQQYAARMDALAGEAQISLPDGGSTLRKCIQQARDLAYALNPPVTRYGIIQGLKYPRPIEP